MCEITNIMRPTHCLQRKRNRKFDETEIEEMINLASEFDICTI